MILLIGNPLRGRGAIYFGRNSGVVIEYAWKAPRHLYVERYRNGGSTRVWAKKVF